MMRVCKLFVAVASLMFAANPAPAYALEIPADATGFDAGFVPRTDGLPYDPKILVPRGVNLRSRAHHS